jgi:hypothetical protein
VSVFGDGSQSRILNFRENFRSLILPKTVRRTIANDRICDTSIESIEPKNIFPPKRSHLSGCMWDFVSVVFEPNLLGPGNINFVENL